MTPVALPICVLGTSHRLAPVAVRERLAFSTADLHSALERLRAETESPLSGAELVILSTCNRTELYLAPRSNEGRAPEELQIEPWEALIRFLAGARGVDPEEIASSLYRGTGVEAVRHLCRVAAGLDSMVLGEAEILGQVGTARDAAAEVGTLGHVLSAVFRSALRSGRRARAETAICRQPASVSSEIVSLIRAETGGLAGRQVLIVGTGRMARRAGEALREQGATDLAVVSRTWSHVERLATDLNATAVPWCDLERAVSQSDIVLCSTSAPHPILTEDLIRAALEGRAGSPPLVLIDSAVPRDIEPGVRSLAGVQLYDLDDLQARLRENLALRRQEAPGVEAIVAEEVDGFEEWWRGTALRPLLAAMRERAESIRRREFERLLSKTPGLPEEARRQVEHLSHALVNKLLHEPTVRLRAESDPALRGTFAEVARHLFGVAEPGAAILADRETP